MAVPGIGPLSNLSSPMRPSRGSLDGGRSARSGNPPGAAGDGRAADSVDISEGARLLGGGLGEVSDGLRGLSADIRQHSADEAREALVAVENLSVTAAPDGALEAAAASADPAAEPRHSERRAAAGAAALGRLTAGPGASREGCRWW